MIYIYTYINIHDFVSKYVWMMIYCVRKSRAEKNICIPLLQLLKKIESKELLALKEQSKELLALKEQESESICLRSF